MNKDALLEKAIRIAVNAHFGQTDKAGAPYILHPLRVMAACDAVDGKIVAVLHDVLEDTEVCSCDLIAAGMPSYIVEAVEVLTRQENESYEDFIERVKFNPIAVSVKIADITDNLDVKRLSTLTDEDTERLNKYLKALAELKR